MAKSRQRPGHKYQKPADIPSRQRAKGRVVWAILFGIFGVAIALFASGQNYIAMAAGAVIGSGLGYIVGKNMEQQAA